MLVDGEARHRAFRVLPGMTVEVDVARPGPRAAGAGRVGAVLAIVYEDEHAAGGRQAGGRRHAPVAGQPRRHARARPAGARRWRAATTRCARASSTGSTGTRRACWWSPEATRRTARWAGCCGAGAIEREYLALVHGRPPARAGRIEAPIGRDPGHRTRMAVDGVVGAAGGHALRGGGGAARLHAAAPAPRDGPHAPDPRAPRGDRPPRRRRPDLRAGERRAARPDRQFLHAARLAFPHP